MSKIQGNGETQPYRPYTMTISRLTVDKLGVKLYDKVSAAVAELVANAYDADAEKVLVRIPLATLLAKRDEDGSVIGHGYAIEVVDDGNGMTPDEAIDHYLKVGRDRRKHPEQGSKSRRKRRSVMGRKGIGKLAPFGICTTIEVISSGGEETSKGYLTTHFAMDFREIMADTDESIDLTPGDRDRTYADTAGTTIRLKDFLPKRVPDAETFHRQLARRFVFAQPDFELVVEDTRSPNDNPPRKVEPFDVPLIDGTRVDVASRPVMTDDGDEYPVQGWLALAKEAYKNEEMAGVRIYARNKIVATTRDFEQPAGFTGEFTMRSYLVGEVHAEWLDSDSGEDLIRTDRQGILWDSELGRALRQWGAEIIREIGAASRKPTRQRVRRMFFEKSDLKRKARERFSDEAVVRAAMSLGEQIGGFAAEDQLTDEDYVCDLVDVILGVAPHKALIEAFQEFGKATTGREATLSELNDLFGKTRIAEMASYSQIAAERVRIIEELQSVVFDDESDEAALQNLLAKGPWLIHPTWTVITQNQALKSLRDSLEVYLSKRFGRNITLAITYERKRPDFTLISVDGVLHIVEIKASGYVFKDSDFERLHNYTAAFDRFFLDNDELVAEFYRGWCIDLIADEVKFSNPINETAFISLEEKERVRRTTWDEFLKKAKVAHEQFLNARDQAAETEDA